MDILNIFRKKKKLPASWSKFYTKEEINFKIPNKTIYEVVKDSSIKYSDKTAYEYFGKKTKYRKFIRQIDACSRSFKYYGINKGDIVTICMPNTPEAIICVYALNKLGAIAHMVHPLSAEEEIKDSVNDTDSKILVIIDMCYEKIENIVNKTNLKKVIFVSASDSMNIFMKVGYSLTQKKYKKHPLSNMYISWNRFIFKGINMRSIKWPKVDKDTPAVILHSGGTSGKPKYVVITSKAFNASAIQTGQICLKNLHPGDSTLAIMPNFHGFGLSVVMHTPFYLGCYSILVPQFDAKKFDVLINKTKPSIILGVPTLYEALIKNDNVKDLDLSYLKYLVSGGDTISKSLEDKINQYLRDHNSKAQLTQGYGLSEALAAVSLCYDNVNKPGSIGIPLARNNIKIIDPATRKRVKPGVVGEICINGPTIMKGYFNNEQETNQALQMHSDGHLWLHTGDAGHMDEDGYLYYDQRIKRMIVSSGYNVYPSHVEEVIERHPDVLQCTVVGMPHPYKQEVPKAFIVLKSDVSATLFKKIEIKEYCKKNLAHYMCPYKYVYRKSLPKTRLGKIDFRSLQQDEGEDNV